MTANAKSLSSTLVEGSQKRDDRRQRPLEQAQPI